MSTQEIHYGPASHYPKQQTSSAVEEWLQDNGGANPAVNTGLTCGHYSNKVKKKLIEKNRMMVAKFGRKNCDA
ncbi:hypothetical protein [Psychrobacter sp. I-STPA10]|uniref:hypothetical protein n=1 Tax=Psychrobacter sp. I-STPA10 TaxID=2585769 RepID=UPI001E334653|nr:hypothetical protein [Psychrobacter sp. I-STPA10]